MNINISTLLDVAIGLIFIFFVFSMFVSGIVELINSLFEQRANLLRKALTKLLGPLVDEFYTHQLTRVKEDNFWGFLKPINYLSADSFSTILIDLITRGDIPTPEGISKPTEQTFEKIKQALLKNSENHPMGTRKDSQLINELIRPILAKSDDLETFKTELEKWYNGYMEQVSGWFKRYAQGLVWVVAALVSIGLNVDTIYLTNQLFNDNGLRERVVAQAVLTAKNGGEAFRKDTTFGNYLSNYDKSLVTPDAVQPTAFVVKPVLTGLDSIGVQSAYLRFVQNRVADLKLPIGWELTTGNSHFQAGQLPILAILGWILTAAALSFGAPFWFDLLLKLVNIRNTARRPSGNP